MNSHFGHPAAGQRGIIGLHENNTRLFEQAHSFWAVVNRESRRIIAGPFDHQYQASTASAQAQRQGFAVVVTSYPGKQQ